MIIQHTINKQNKKNSFNFLKEQVLFSREVYVAEWLTWEILNKIDRGDCQKLWNEPARINGAAKYVFHCDGVEETIYAPHEHEIAKI